jgi:DNA topoisomerase-1
MKSEYIIRKKNNNSFQYYTKNNSRITDTKILDKIKKIYIAPAYTDVKIYLGSNLLATGIDTAGRTQYVYSDKMKKLREHKKYKKLIKISKNIDKLKNKISKDLLKKEFSKDKLVALVLKIMDLCNFRSGNKKYEEKYGSFGITTVHKKHISFKNNSTEIEFIGKKGVNNHCILKDKHVQDIIKKVYNISSKDNPYLFSINGNSNREQKSKEETIHINIYDVNAYLKPFGVTTKDLRTWNANIIFLKNIKNLVENLDNEFIQKYNGKTDKQRIKIRKQLIKEAIKKTAESLHHTPAICKSSYIYKKILEVLENNNNIFLNLKKNNKNNGIEDVLKKYLI